MKRIILIMTILFLSLSTYSYAGYFIFHDGEKITDKRASCGAVCSNNTDALRVTEAVYFSTSKLLNKVVGGVVVNKTQSEIDAEAQAIINEQILAEIQRQADKDEDLANTDLSNINLPKIEAKIDAINNIAQMRTFLKRLVRYISIQ